MRKFFIFLPLIFISAFIARPLSASDSEAQAQQGVENFIKSIRSMKFPVKDDAALKAIQDANLYLDLEALSKKALSSHWDTATSEEQTSFINLMTKLSENVAYPQSSRFMGNYQITYPKVEPSENGFNVHSIIKQEEEGLDAEVIYHVYLKEDRAKIDDVIVDGVSITEDLKYQFDKIIGESKFSGLLEAMQKRLADSYQQNETSVA